MRYIFITVCIAALAFLSSCNYQNGERNIEYSPNMYHSIPPEPYSQAADDWAEWTGVREQTVFRDGLNAQRAPEGTVPRAEGWYHSEAFQPYHLENDTAGYRIAGEQLTSPLENVGYADDGIPVDCTKESYENGKRLYTVYCSPCHGNNGDGQGNLATLNNKPFEGIVPTYKSADGTGLKNMTAGKMFHSITYGKGQMGSYASQLTPQQRWEVICYVQHFQRMD